MDTDRMKTIAEALPTSSKEVCTSMLRLAVIIATDCMNAEEAYGLFRALFKIPAVLARDKDGRASAGEQYRMILTCPEWQAFCDQHGY